jgi:uncharacterized membrane protein
MPASPSHYVPQLSRDTRPLLVWSLLAGFCLLIMTMIIGAPLAWASGHRSWAAVCYATFSHLCHQIPERSFSIAGHQFAVCSRCTGIYGGFAVATLGYPLLRSLRSTDTPARIWLFLAAAPVGIDFALGYFGIWENTHLSRFVTGALLGSVAVLYVMPGLVELSLKDWRRKAVGSRQTAGGSS